MWYLLVRILREHKWQEKSDGENTAEGSSLPPAGRAAPDLWRLKDNLRETSRMSRVHMLTERSRCDGQTNFGERNGDVGALF